MRYKVKWKTATEQPLAPELFDGAEQAKERAREILRLHRNALIEIWNEEETWQVVTPAGIEDWCDTQHQGSA